MAGLPASSAAQALLAAAAHAEYVTTVIRPVLAHGGIVVCDGFQDDVQARSDLAGSVDTAEQMRALRWGSGRLVPHLTVVLDDVDAHLDHLRQLLVARAHLAPDRYLVLPGARRQPAPSEALRNRILDVLSTYGLLAEAEPSTDAGRHKIGKSVEANSLAPDPTTPAPDRTASAADHVEPADRPRPASSSTTSLPG